MDIEVRDLTKSYGGRVALRPVSFCLPQGGVLYVMGTSGGGKTTLLHLMMGLVRPDGGTLTGLSGRRLGAVFQENRLCEQLDAPENVALVPGGDRPRRELLGHFARVGLTEADCKKPVSQLSGGQKRRVAIVRGLLSDAEVLFFDEPFKGLDAETRRRVVSYTAQERRARSMVIVTHDGGDRDLLPGAELVLSGNVNNP